MTGNDQVAAMLADFRESLGKLEAMPTEGVVLFFAEAGLALAFGEDGKPRPVRLLDARVFSADELGTDEGLAAPELRNTYRNGHGQMATATEISAAKAVAVERLQSAITILEQGLEEGS